MRAWSLRCLHIEVHPLLALADTLLDVDKSLLHPRKEARNHVHHLGHVLLRCASCTARFDSLSKYSQRIS